ncbi:MAG: DeoR/GlpR family DNA-binding transcription regulator [Chloroflexota bacterium]|nr:DeoR/GlpR family DNA-binding transcription regulator [Chloroflexota bacterium]
MLLPSQRRQRILEDIYQSGSRMVSDLSEKYGVSEMTIRRDLRALEKEGYVKREHGGAVRRPASPAEPHIIDWEKRHQLFPRQKASIARVAVHELIADGDVIILEGGTTVTAMSRHLAHKRDLTVVTNGLYTTDELHRRLSPSTTIISVGGILRRESATWVGPLAERFFHEFHANKLFLSATGLTLEAGITDPNMLETQIKKAMVASASKVFMLMDSSKFGVKSLMTVLPLEKVSLLITDEGSPNEIIRGLETRGIDVWIAPESQ